MEFELKVKVNHFSFLFVSQRSIDKSHTYKLELFYKFLLGM